MGFMLMPVRKPARTSNIFSRQVSAQAVHADNLRAVKVRSAEATELPVWKRPPVSVTNRLCHPWTLDHGSSGSRRFTRIKGADERGLV